MVLNKDELFEELQLATERVTVGKGEVIIAEIGAADYFSLYTSVEMQTNGAPDMAKIRPALVARCVVDEAGERILSDEDAAALAKGSAAKFNKLAEAAMRMNGLIPAKEGN